MTVIELFDLFPFFLNNFSPLKIENYSLITFDLLLKNAILHVNDAVGRAERLEQVKAIEPSYT